MLRLRVLAHVLVVVLVPVLPADAAVRAKPIRAGACKVLTDPTGDVRLNDAPGTEASGDTHLDVENVYVYSHGKAVDVTVYDVALDANRRGTWTVTWTVGTTTYAVRASLGTWGAATRATAAYSAGIVDRLVPVKGQIDVASGMVTVTAPYATFGGAGRAGTKWGHFTADAEEVLADVAAPARVRLHDAGTSKATYRAGARCDVSFGPPPPPPGHAPRRD